jgi:hypothetical protein
VALRCDPAMSSSLGTVQAVAQSVAGAIARQDGLALAAALRFDLGNTSLLGQLSSGRVGLEAVCGSTLSEPYDEMLLEHFHFLRAAQEGDDVKAYAHCERACACFQAVFEKDTDWSLPALHALCLSLRLAAARADRALVAKGDKPSRQQEAARSMQKFFQVTVTDRSALPVSKKWGALGVINALFKVRFGPNIRPSRPSFFLPTLKAAAEGRLGRR